MMEPMALTLAKLRGDLEFLPSPVEDRPGLLIRDPFHYSTTTLIIPPLLVECLHLFDGESSHAELHEFLVRLTGDIRAGEAAESLAGALAEAGFLDDETHHAARRRCHEEFAAASVRQAAHDGISYPEDAGELRRLLAGYLDGGAGCAAGSGALIGIAAPHASFDGAPECYRAAYGALTSEHRDKVFVVLGTSHSGQQDRLGLTRKPFQTPLGTARTEVELVDRLAQGCGNAVEMEDYCHAAEHSIEFQVLFLQHIYGADVRILPILAGTYAHAILSGTAPEEAVEVRRLFDALSAMAASEGERLFWVLGIDLAHLGRRYGDDFAAQSPSPSTTQLETRDRARLERISAGDAAGFWRLVCQSSDDLKWCGASPLYTFLKVMPQARAAVAAYQQWNIDEESLVSCAALHFHAPPRRVTP